MVEKLCWFEGSYMFHDITQLPFKTTKLTSKFELGFVLRISYIRFVITYLQYNFCKEIIIAGKCKVYNLRKKQVKSMYSHA